MQVKQDWCNTTCNKIFEQQLEQVEQPECGKDLIVPASREPTIAEAILCQPQW